jgi:hypothetical protein
LARTLRRVPGLVTRLHRDVALKVLPERYDGDVVELGPLSIIYRCSTSGLSTEAIPIR